MRAMFNLTTARTLQLAECLSTVEIQLYLSTYVYCSYYLRRSGLGLLRLAT